MLAAAAIVSAVGGAVGAASPQSGEPVTIRWFVGLGTGAEPEQIAAQEDVVEEFNDSQDDIELEIEIVDNEVAYDTLATQIAAGDAPDIIGPIGIRGSNYFAGQFLDLEPLVESTGFDLSGYDEAQVEFWREDDGALTALPFGVFPSVHLLQHRPVRRGRSRLPAGRLRRALRRRRPVGHGQAGRAGHAADGRRQRQRRDEPGLRPRRTSCSGASTTSSTTTPGRSARSSVPASFVADDGTAQIPENWIDSWQWYVDLIAAGAAPNQSQIDSDTLAAGNAFNTGNVAMAFTHLWYTCCVRDDEGVGREFWDLAAVPEYNGEATSKLHADTFRILDSTENPEAAFEVLDVPARRRGRPCCSTRTAACRPGQICAIRSSPISTSCSRRASTGRWPIDGLERPDVPSHESNMPNFDEAEAVIDAWEDRLTTEPGLDVAAAAEELRVSLDAVFGGAPAPTVGTEPAGTEPAGTSRPARRRRRPRAEDSDRKPGALDDADRRHRSTPSSPTDPTGITPGRVGPGRPGALPASDGVGGPACCSSSPWLIGLSVFYLIPLVASLVFSFTDYELVDQDDKATEFIGLDNWRRLFSDPEVRHSAWVTIKFAVIFVPMSLLRAARPRLPADVAPPVGIERLPGAVLPAGDRALRRRHVRVGGLPQRLRRAGSTGCSAPSASTVRTGSTTPTGSFRRS